MPVYSTPHADLILAALSIAQLIAGITCIYLSRESDLHRPLPAWKWLGIGLCISGLRDWVGIIGISYGYMRFYFFTTLLLALVGLCLIHAAKLEIQVKKNRSGPAHVPLAIALGAVMVWQTIQLITGFEMHQAFQVLVTKGLFLAAACMLYFSAREGMDPLPAGYRHVLLVVVLYTIATIITLPPGISELAVSPAGNMVQAGLYAIRVLLAFVICGMVWNLYGKAVGVAGWIRLWPLLVLNLLVVAGFVFVIVSSMRYAAVVENQINDAATNIATLVPAAQVRAATRHDPQAMKETMASARRLNLFLGYGKIPTRVDILIPVQGSIDGKILDAGPVADLPPPEMEGLPNFSSPFQSEVLFYYTAEKRNPVGVAPILDQTGHSVGAVLVTVSAIELTKDFYRYKRPLLLFMPIAFLVFLLLVRGQQRAWLASHSINWEEALKTGALANDLAGVIITRNERILDINRRVCEMLACTPDQLIGKDLREALSIIHESDRQFIHQLLRAFKEEGKAFFEMEVCSPTGKKVHTMVYARILASEADGDTIIWESVDITRLKEMENEVRQSRDYLQMVIDNIPVAVFAKDMDNRYTLANNLFATLLGLDNAESAIGRTAHQIKPEMVQSDIEHDAKCVEMDGTPHIYEQAFEIGGERKYYEVSKTLKWIGEGREKYVIVDSIHDFTARKNMEDAVQNERHFLMQLIDALPMIVCFIDAERIVRLCNTAFAREAGVDGPDALIGKPYDSIAPLGPVDIEGEKRMLELGYGTKDLDIVLRRRGTPRHFILRRIAMAAGDGKVLGLLKAFWETTDLVRANHAALSAARAKNAFLSNMSHELRTPMNGILGPASLIIDHATPEQRLSAEIIIKSAQTLQMVVDEVMDRATMDDETDRFAIQVGSFALLPAIEETLCIESCIVEAGGVDLLLSYDFRISTAYYGDARRLRQILVQVLSHCARISPHSCIRLSVGTGGNGMLSFAVDFQPGDNSNAQSLEALFLASAQASSDSVRAEKLGIFQDRVGLPMTWRLIQAMRGVLQVTDENDGVRCEVLIPLKPDLSCPEYTVAPDLSGKRILVAAKTVRAESARAILEYAHAQVVTISDPDGLQAQVSSAAGKGEPYSLILLDAEFIPAAQVQDQLTALYGTVEPKPAVAVMTRNQDMEHVLAAYQHRVDSYITYPLCPDDVWKNTAEAGLPDRLRKSTAARYGQRPETPPAPARSTTNAQAAVLLVEDNTVNQVVQMGILKRLGCSCVLAKNGKEALDRIVAGEEYEYIFMDCMMPVMDGYEATSRIRQHERTHPDQKRHSIIALTANSVAGDKEKCLAAGMDDYLAKPVTLEAVRDMLARHSNPAAIVPAGERERKQDADL